MSRVLIAGGGIGGLVAARALHRAGATVEVVEQAPSFEPVGAGITIQANARAILDALDVALPAEDVVNIGRFEMRSGDRVVMEGDSSVSDLETPSVNIHRADLHRALLAATDGIPKRLGVAVTGVAEGADGVAVTFADGSEGRWDVVVGADGFHSAVRAALLPHDPPPRYAGQTCWRFAVEAPELVPDVTVERWTPGRRVGVVPLSRGRIYVYLVESAPPGTPGPGTDSPEALGRFVEVDPRIGPMLERLDGVPVHHGDLFDRPAISFGRGRVVLIGDAAHAMTPNLGQGAGTAIEDAAALAIAWTRGADLPAALTSARRKRVSSVQAVSWRIGKLAHVGNPVARWLRDRLLGLVPASASEKQALAMWEPGFLLARQLREHLPHANAAPRPR